VKKPTFNYLQKASAWLPFRLNPFRREPLLFSIMARRLPKRVHSSSEELRKTFAGTRHFKITFTVYARRALSLAALH
jgi:hypothetical protein